MPLTGKPIRLTKWIHGDQCVVRVEVNAILPDFAPDEPHLEPAAVKLLDHLQQLANAGHVEELSRHGRVYVRQTA